MRWKKTRAETRPRKASDGSSRESQPNGGGPATTSPSAPSPPLELRTLAMLPGRLESLDSSVLKQEIRLIGSAARSPSFTLGWNIGEPPEHITLNHASVKPLHARVTFRDGTWCVESLAWDDPVWINEGELPEGDPPRPLQDGDHVRLGSVAFRFRFP